MPCDFFRAELGELGRITVPQATRKYLGISKDDSIGFLVTVNEDIIDIMKKMAEEKDESSKMKWRH